VPNIDVPNIEHADRHRVAILAVAWVGLVGVSIAIGSQMSGSTSVDHRISVWFVDHRSSTWNSVTSALSNFASTFVVIGIALLVVILCLVRHRFTDVTFMVVAMAGEVTMFLTITLLVDRARPDVARLDSAPPTSSFPSGHTFACFVLWNAIAVLAVRQDWRPPLRTAARVVAVAAPAAVGLGRIYRGMHHPTDVVASIVLGLVWMIVVSIVVTPDAFRRHASEPAVESADQVAVSR
jgi:undecaprenyl-diphosphatase